MSKDESNVVRGMGRGERAAKIIVEGHIARRSYLAASNPVRPPVVTDAASPRNSLDNAPIVYRDRQITSGADTPEPPSPSQAGTIMELNSASVSPVLFGTSRLQILRQSLANGQRKL